MSQEILAQQLTLYLRHLAQKNASPYTRRNYQREISEFLGFLAGEGVRTWSDIDRGVLRRYLLWLQAQGYGKASIARRIYEIRSFLKFLQNEKLLPEEVRAKLDKYFRPPKLPRRLPRYLEPEEVASLIAAPDSSPLGQRDRAILELLYAGGMRVSELVNFNLDHLRSQGEVTVMGKGGKERIVLLGKPAQKALSAYLRDVRPRLVNKASGSALFLNHRGGRLTVRGVQAILDRWARAAGIQRRVTPHLLRHTFATHLLGGGADLRVVQELLGHKSLSSTQIYTHVPQGRAREVYLQAHPLARDESKAKTNT